MGSAVLCVTLYGQKGDGFLWWMLLGCGERYGVGLVNSYTKGIELEGRGWRIPPCYANTLT